MTLVSLQALTWGTVTGAVVSALLLASGEPGMPDFSKLRRADAMARHPSASTGGEAARKTPSPHATAVVETPAQTVRERR